MLLSSGFMSDEIGLCVDRSFYYLSFLSLGYCISLCNCGFRFFILMICNTENVEKPLFNSIPVKNGEKPVLC